MRFPNTGDYRSFEIAGFPFFLIRGRDGDIRAFHNVCRHRAYPVVQKESGCSNVISCRYHGWAYNTRGELIKAPQFDQVEGFDRSKNGLFEISVHITPQGLIFVNFDCSEEGPVSFKEWYGGLEEELDEVNFDAYEYHSSYQLDGRFNWKTLMDGYQECYHCPTAHPGLSKAFKMPTYKVTPKGDNYCRHFAEIKVPTLPDETVTPSSTPPDAGGWLGFLSSFGSSQSPPRSPSTNRGGDTDGLWIYLFPNNGVNCYSPAFYTIRVVPKGVDWTVLEYDIYGKKDADPSEVEEFVTFLKEVEQEDFNLCQATQKNLNSGVYMMGPLHPIKEKGVLFYQGKTKEMIMEHLKQEKAVGKEIFPAFAGLKYAGEEGKEADSFCKSLDCLSGNGISAGQLDW